MLIKKAIYEVLSVLEKKDRVRALFCTFLLTIASVLELFGLGALVPVIQVAVNKEFLDQESYLNPIYNFTNVQDPNHFILLVLAIALVFTIVKNTVLLWLNAKVINFAYDMKRTFSMRSLLYYYSKGYLFFKQNESHELLNDVQNHSTFYSQGVILPLFRFINEILMIAFILTGILLYNWEAVLVLLVVVVPAVGGFYYLIREKMRLTTEGINSLVPRMQSTLYQSIYGYVDAKITNTESKFKTQYGDYLHTFRKLMTEKELYNIVPQRLIETAMIASVVALLIVALYFAGPNQNIITLLGVFVLAAYRLMPSINRIMLAILSIRSHRFSFDVIKKASQYYYSTEAKTSEVAFANKISIKNVNFSYPSRQSVINDLSFEVLKGSTIGIIGKSGSGKSTFIQLLLRFLEEESGGIYVDDTKLNPTNKSSWRDIIGYVPQDIFIFNGTIAENVAFGQLENEIDKDRVNECLKMANIDQFVQELDEGINSMVGEDGASLSGGQKQRIAIARALYSGIEILVLDEATSALDNETEKEITNTISTLADGQLTIILVAHRFTTLEPCSVIYEFEGGGVGAQYNHQELMLKIDGNRK